MSWFRRTPRQARDQQPLPSISGRHGVEEPEGRSRPAIAVTNAMNDRIRQVEAQLEAERQEELRRLLEQEGTR